MRLRLAVLTLLLGSLSAFAADNLDSRLAVQRVRAGLDFVKVFAALDHPNLAENEPVELADLRFLLAYAPLSDLTAQAAGGLLDNVKLARRARSLFPWGSQVTDELYRHFVLPHRVSQEPFIGGWRERFLNELWPRVKDLSMTAAALEVNHWCHEYVTYQPSDSRDQDPLTTLRAGLGRCEEEMIFTICALRSVGIPARQCYTPYWAHTDDNHAWVEVWTDGRWHYFGACEPEPELDRAWFTDAVARAMLVVSTAYGDYHGGEPVLKRYGSSTLINSTAVYGRTRELTVSVFDSTHQPLPKAKVIFNLFNYGCLMPALALEADSAGHVTLICGEGDWFLSAGRDSTAALLHVPAHQSHVDLVLGSLTSLQQLQQADYTPPPTPAARAFAPHDSLFTFRLAREDSLRESRLWDTWAREANLPPLHIRPDSVWCYRTAAKLGVDGNDLSEIFQQARGNWGHLYRFLTGCFPDFAAIYNTAEIHARLILLKTLSGKDRRDFSSAALEDHFRGWIKSQPLPELLVAIDKLDSVSRARITDYVIRPRINIEPSAAWRGRALWPMLLSSHSDFATSRNDSILLAWLKTAIVIDTTRDRLGAPLTPTEVLTLQRGTTADIERLYVALCRVRGIPARFNPVTGRLERWQDSLWVSVVLQTSVQPKSAPVVTGLLRITAPADTAVTNALYMQSWAVSLWKDDHLEALDFEYNAPYRSLTWPQELPVGLYCLTAARRHADGSAPITFNWFTIHPHELTTLPLRIDN